MKKLLTGALCAVLTGCGVIHFNNRSVVNYTENKAEMYGKIANQPQDNGAKSVAAEKTNDIKSDVSTGGGTSKNAD